MNTAALRLALCAATVALLGTLPGCGEDAKATADATAQDSAEQDQGASFGDGLASDAAKPDAAKPDAVKPDTASPSQDAIGVDQAGQDAEDPVDVAIVDVLDTAGDSKTDVPVVAASCKDRCGKYDPKAPCQCDEACGESGDCCDDYPTLCAAAAGCKADGDCDDFDPCTADSCVSGTCKHAGTGACCKDAGDCDDFDACTADTCTSSGCTHAAKSCDDSQACTTDSCDSKTGECASKIQAGFCAIEGTCRIAGEMADNSCLLCDPSKAQDAWTATVGVACEDGLSCTTGDTCDAKGACVGVAKSGCCKSDADCVTSEICSTGTCNATSGACSFGPKPGCCTVGTCCDLVGHTIKKAGEACGTVAVQIDYACNGNLAQKREGLPGCDGLTGIGCKKTAESLAWGPWKTLATCSAAQKCVQQAGSAPVCESTLGTCTSNAACDDKNPCTDDSCLSGTCANLPKKCPDGAGCQVGTCDPVSGACKLSVADTSCSINGTCYASGAKHPTDGCLTCQPTKSQSAWSLTSTCACTSGVCCDVAAGKIQPFGTSCASDIKATQYACSADGKVVQQRTGTLGCTGKSNTCSTSASNYAWSAWSTLKNCGAGTTCEVTDPTVAGTCKAGADPLCGQSDKYEAGTAAKTAYNLGSFADDAADLTLSPQVLLGSADDTDVLRYSITDAANSKAPTLKVSWSGGGTVKVCAWYACSAGAGGSLCKSVICPSGSVSDSNPDVSSQSGNGCCLTGQTGSLSWTPAPSTGTGSSGTAYVGITNTAGKCQQVSLTATFGGAAATECTAGTKCCTASGTFAPKATACGTTTMAAEYKCDSTAQGGKILTRKAVQGCLGTSTTCSTAASNYAWGDWTTVQTCPTNAVCQVTAVDQPGTCKVVSVCAPGSTCCTTAGAWAPAGTSCGSSAAKVEYKCSGTGLGAAAQVRKGYGGCTGSGSTCSTATTSLVWSSWSSYQTCSSSQLCVAGATATTPPSCQTPPVDLCAATDPNYGTTSQAAPKDLGKFSDTDAAQWLAPKVTLSTDADKDWFKYQISDDFNLNDPSVSVTWNAAKPVTVCAHYQCSFGPNGKDCDKVTCPAGSTAATNTSVSAVNPNGCCITGATGTLTFSPAAPGTLDEGGWVHFSVKNNTGSGCQQVGVKLAFGGSTTPVCTPGTSCCADTGTWATKGSACGLAVKSEYQCSKTTAGGTMQKRDGKGSCGGTSATCGTSTLVWGPWNTALACSLTEYCATPSIASPGICVTPGAGSCGGACGGKSKTGTCYCDATCAAIGDCCSDFGSTCGGSCTGSCGAKAANGVCWCDSLCSGKGDCCLDKASKCGG